MVNFLRITPKYNFATAPKKKAKNEQLWPYRCSGIIQGNITSYKQKVLHWFFGFKFYFPIFGSGRDF